MLGKGVSAQVLTSTTAVAVGFVVYVAGVIFTNGPLITAILNYLVDRKRRSGLEFNTTSALWASPKVAKVTS